ncbi:MAG: RtcB family protein [Sumerlaeia bacterium]
MSAFKLMDAPVPLAVWGQDQIDQGALDQIEVARRLPISVAAAQMPDGHVGYGLPIGGVLAVRDAVIPYAVGVDIACRMKLSITDMPSDRYEGFKGKLKNALSRETCFGVGGEFRKNEKRSHPVMDSPAWDAVPPHIGYLKDKAWAQLGTSGSGNHFAEWGLLEVKSPDLGVEPGEYVALMSHSGSRGLGANIAQTYSRLAKDLTELPPQARNLAWLSMHSPAGQEYWASMNLAGEYASANHDCIHREVLKSAGLKPLLQIENHHNFAWKEIHNGEEVIVHRKGATPAGEGVLGVIPGSMGDPGFVVRGRGNAASLCSAAHGAGRAHSRKAARQTITGSAMRAYLAERGIELLAAGVDEAPQAYKRIEEVMEAQKDLVETLAIFWPRMVLMARGGKAED